METTRYVAAVRAAAASRGGDATSQQTRVNVTREQCITPEPVTLPQWGYFDASLIARIWVNMAFTNSHFQSRMYLQGGMFY